MISGVITIYEKFRICGQEIPDGRMKPCFHLTDQDYWGRLSKQSLIEHGIGMRGESN